MATIFAAIVVMLLIVGAMSIGVLMGRKAHCRFLRWCWRSA